MKRALGYDSSETVEEYTADGEDMTIVRKKITTKNVPPDISAAKILLEDLTDKNEVGKLTDEQLKQEKERLLKLLKEKDNSENSKK